MNTLRNALNSIRSTAAFSAASRAAHRPASGNRGVTHALSVQASAVITMDAQLLSRVSTGIRIAPTPCLSPSARRLTKCATVEQPTDGRKARFEPGDQYAFGITTLGGSMPVIQNVASGLARIGHTASTSAVLAGNFEVAGIDTIAPPDREALAARATAHENLTLRFVTTFRLERPEAEHRSKTSAISIRSPSFPRNPTARHSPTRCMALSFASPTGRCGRWPFPG